MFACTTMYFIVIERNWQIFCCIYTITVEEENSEEPQQNWQRFYNDDWRSLSCVTLFVFARYSEAGSVKVKEKSAESSPMLIVVSRRPM